MTKRYLYIEESGSCINAGTRFYNVWVGHSVQADRDYQFLVQYSAAHYHYFEKFSDSVSEFFRHIQEAYPGIDTQLVPISARELVRAFKKGIRPACPQHIRHNAMVMNTQLSLSFRISSNLNLSGGYPR